MVGIFQKRPTIRRARPPKPVTLRDFSGGLNTVDDDDVLSTKFAVTAKNIQIGTDGSMNTRFGTYLFADVANAVSGNIVNMIYYQDFILAVTDQGEIAKVDGSGTASLLWNDAVAATLFGAPSGWSSLTNVTFVPFKKDISIHNGVDKPLRVKDDLSIGYLADDATGSNVNVPIGRYGCTVANYHVVAGIPAAPTQITITSVGTIGTFPGDPAPNDAISIDVGAYTSLSAKEIRGVAGFRNYLLVFFRDSTLVITLGNYQQDGDTRTHVPLYNDTLAKFGNLSQRNLIYLENDIMFASPHGVCSAKRNIFVGAVESKTLTEIIAPTYNGMSRVLSEDQEKNNTFMVRDSHGNTVYTFLNGKGIAYTFNDELRIRGWSTFEGWNWTCACESKQGRVFFAYGSKIYRLGNDVFAGEKIYGDQAGEYDKTYATGLVVSAGDKVRDPVSGRVWSAVGPVTISAGILFADLAADAPDQWIEYLGIPIDFEWELPWADFKDPERVKHIRSVKVGSKGTAPFTLAMYTDGLYKDEDGVIIHDPAIQLNLVGSSQQGFGGSPDQSFGGGRKSNDPRLYKAPVKFKRIKFKFTGSTTKSLKLSSITLLHTKGSFSR